MRGTPGQQGRESPQRGQLEWDRVAQEVDRSCTGVCAHPADALTATRDPGLAGEDGREGAAAPWGRARTVREGGLVNEAIAGHGACTGHLRRSTGAGTVEPTLGALVGKTRDPRAESGIRTMPRVRDRVEALPCDHVAHGLGTAEDTGLLRLWHEGVEGREGMSGTLALQSAPGRALA